MRTYPPLSMFFLAHLGESKAAELAQCSTLESELQAALTAARAAWPQLSLPSETFLGYLAARLGPEASAQSPLAGSHVTDLYLACGCANAEPAALAALETNFLAGIGAVVHTMQSSALFVQEVTQQVRIELFVNTPQRPALIHSYAGRGSLRGWLRAIAVRRAMKLRQPDRQPTSGDEDVLRALASVEPSPEIEHFRRHYGTAFKAAFTQAFGSLDRRQRNVLRHHFLDGLTVAQIGLLYQSHRATVARWIVGARAQLLAHTRSSLRKQFAVEAAELDSILRIVKSHIEISLRRLLSDEGQGAGESARGDGPGPPAGPAQDF